MKKHTFLAAAALLLAFALLFTGCGNQIKYFAVTAPESAYAPGDEVVVTITLNNVENVAMFDLRVDFDPAVLTLSEAEEGDVKDFIFLTNPGENSVLINAFTATTYDFSSETVATLYFTVNEGASGTTEIKCTATMFDVGLTDSGDELKELVKGDNIASSLSLKIAG